MTRWPLAEALAAYEALLAERARTQYMVEFLAWNVRRAAGSKERMPKPPKIIGGR